MAKRLAIFLALALVVLCTAQRASGDPPDMGGMHGPNDTAGGSAGEMNMNPHMKMLHRTSSPSAGDRRRADELLTTLRKALEPFKDYRAAQADGYVQYLPQIPQEIYHFTNWGYAYQAEFKFDPARPTSLMYKKTADGFELVGAMYTAPRKSTDAELDARVPLTVGTWHEHVNLCVPPNNDWKLAFVPHPQFGLGGSISSAQECANAGGAFVPVVYNWMVHVWPYERDQAAIWKPTAH